MASPAAVLQILVTANTAQATTALTKTNTQLKGTEANANRATAATSRMGAAARAAGTLLAGGLAYGLYKGVKAGIDFEKQMDSVGAVAEANTKEMKKLNAQALKLGQSTAFSASEVATAQGELAKGGLKVKQILGGALPAALKLAAAGELELGEAAETTVNSMKLFGLKGRDAVKVADMLATAANTTTADVADFSMALKQGGSAAKAAGLDMNQTVTILEALAEAGIKNSDAGTSMKTALLQLIAPTEKQKALTEQLGLNFLTANGEMKDAAGISAELRGALDGQTKAQQAANLKVLAGTDGFRTLAALYDAGPAKLDKLAAANERNGTAQEIAKKKMDNTAGSLEQLQGAFETLSIKLYQGKAGQFRELIDGATDKLREFTKIVTSKKLTNDEKISKVMEMISDALKDAIPKIADAAFKVGTAITKGIARAFFEGDLLTRLFIGAGVFKLFGGGSVLAAAGKKIGTKLGAAAGPALAVGLITLGLSDKQFREAAAEGGKRIGELFVNGMIGAINLGLREIFDSAQMGPLGEGLKQLGIDFGDAAPQIDTVAFSNYQKVIDSGVKEPAERGLEAIRGLKHEMRDLDKAMENSKPTVKSNAANMDMLGDNISALRNPVRTTREMFGSYFDKIDKGTKVASDAVEKHKDRAGSNLDSVNKKTDKSGDAWNVWSGKAKDSAEKTNTKIGRMASNVIDSYGNMANGASDGLKVLGDNTNKALEALSVKDAIKFSIKLAKKATNAVKHLQTGGVIVPGQGDGDKVPAMLEPGEVVWNKKAVAAMGGAARANSINKKIPRFQKGGVAGGLDFALGPYAVPPITYAEDHAGSNSHVHITGTTTPWVVAIGKQLQRMGMLVGEHPAFGGVQGSHSATGGHYDALAIDVNDPSGNEPRSWVASIARILGGSGIAGAVAEKIARVILKGPDGPLKDIGQSALDKARNAANKYIASQAPSGVDVGPGSNIKGLPKALQKYNHTYPKSSGFGDGYALPFNVVAALAEWAGAPGVSMARTAIGESQLEPGAVGYDSNTVPGASSIGYGLHMITSGVGNDDMIKRYGGVGQLLNPVVNSQAMNEIFQSAGYGAWYSDTKDTSNTHYNGPLLKQAGGIVQKFAKGGEAQISGGKTDPAWKRFARARSIAQRLKDILGERGRVARIDERIGIAETLAGLDSSPGGSDVNAAELAKQIGLNERLLEVMVRARKLANSGLRELNFPKGMSTRGLKPSQLKGLRGTFGSYLTDLTGVTGDGGRIFDTKVRLDELRNTSTATDNTAQMADLSELLRQANARYAISQAQYGVFDGFRARGGSVAPGKWAIAGERGPEVVHGPASVTPISSSPSLTIEELNVYADGRVGMRIGGKEFEAAVKQVNRKQARKGGRVLPGRAGS